MVKVRCKVKGCISEEIEAKPGSRFTCMNGHVSLCKPNGQVSAMTPVRPNGFGAMRKLGFRIEPPSRLERSPQEILQEKQSKLRIESSLQSVNLLAPTLQPNDTLTFPKGGYKKVEKSTKRIIGGLGDVFSPVVKGLKAVETSSAEPNLLQLEQAANAYIADYNRRVEEGKTSKKPFKPDKITTNKLNACKDALEKIRQLRVKREMSKEFATLPNPPRTFKDELAVNGLRGKLIVESGGSKPISGEEGKGASESFFLTDPNTNEKAFVFKPGDGEFVPGLGWESGGGAPREVMVSAVNEELRTQLGLDCGVAPTTLVSLDHPSLGSGQNKGKSKRVGALQGFVKKDPDPQKMVVDKKFFNTVPQREIEKIAILDFVTLQMDRQPDNILVTSDTEGNTQLTPIDGGSTFPGREAYEAFRRQFSANHLFSGEEGKKKFSEEALEQIQAIDEQRIVERMRSAKEEMSKIDPTSGSKIRNESIEITRRSILFLKAASRQLTKSQIANVYANFFQNVLDAAPEDLNKAIAKAIQSELDHPALVLQIEQFPDAKAYFSKLGWPPKQFQKLIAENPELLLKILDQDRECEGTVTGIAQLLSTLEGNEVPVDFKIHSIESLWDKYAALTKLEEQSSKNRNLQSPQLLEAMEKIGWTFELPNGKTMNDQQKHDHLKRAVAYINAGGDQLLKQKGLNPKTIPPEEKTYLALGGDEAYQKLSESGFAIDLEYKTSVKLLDLEAYTEYLKLGGNEVFVKMGGIASMRLSPRVQFMRENEVLLNKEGPTAVLLSLENMLELIMWTKDRCALAEIELGKKRNQYSQLDRESLAPMDEEARVRRLKEVGEEDLYISSIMKKFGPWNAKIISPWKELQTSIKKESRLATDERIKDLNREVSRAYDAYVEVFGVAQDLGQDFMDLLKRIKKRLERTVGTQEETILEIRKLLETMNSELGAGSMIRKQVTELESIQQEIEEAKNSVPPYSQEQWDASRDWETKVRQRFEVVKANYRAANRVKANLQDLIRPWPNSQAVTNESQSVIDATNSADLTYARLELLVTELLKEIVEQKSSMETLGAEALLVSLNEMAETIRASTTKCEELKEWFALRSPGYEEYEQKLLTELDEKTRELRRKELVSEMDTLRKEGKKFGSWNEEIITPWKRLQAQVVWAKLGDEKKVEKANRSLTQAYDAYVVALGEGQDLGNDLLELVSSLFDRFGGKPLNESLAFKELDKLITIFAADFGPLEMLRKQRAELQSIDTFIKNSIGKTESFLPRQWKYLMGCETRTRQTFEIAKANHRAAGRARKKVDQFALPFQGNEKVDQAYVKLTQFLQQTEEVFVEVEYVVPILLRQIKELEDLRPEI